jgi:hypothetical protein
MTYSDRNLANFSLRGLSIEELRELADSYLAIDEKTLSGLAKSELISQLSDAAAQNRGLSQSLRKRSIAIKPSFYLMRFSGNQISLESAKTNMRRYLQKKKYGLKNLESQLIDEYSPGSIQILFTWHSDLAYWSPSIRLERVEQLELGFGILDYKAQKALVACHTTKERDELSKLLAQAFEVKLDVLALTKPLLEQIGTFDQVKRASYVIAAPDGVTPSNITYADEDLSIRQLAREEERNPRSQRAQSFYRVPILNEVQEEGLGATSDSGKLWIPKETPIDLVREYGTALLGKISGTLDAMTQKGQIDDVLSTFSFEEMEGIAFADPLSFRRSLADLIRNVIIMLSKKEAERTYSISPEIARYGAPHFFFQPMLNLVDPETREVAFWKDPISLSSSTAVFGTLDKLHIKSFTDKSEIDVSALRHPITSSIIQIDNFLDALELIPNERLLRLALEVASRVSPQLPQLKQIKSIEFRISRNTIRLNLDKAYGASSISTLLHSSELVEFSPVFTKHTVPVQQRSAINEKLIRLGEKCANMSDENCQMCLKDKKWLCLRSLVGGYLKETQILAHKGIELCDMTSRVNIDGKGNRVWAFAKLPSGKKENGLTLRNAPGAVLLAQICGQLDKSALNVVLVITPATVNQDFQERLGVLCSAFGKRLCFLDADDLGRMLVDFEDRALFDGIDVGKIYKSSMRKSYLPKKQAKTLSG